MNMKNMLYVEKGLLLFNRFDFFKKILNYLVYIKKSNWTYNNLPKTFLVNFKNLPKFYYPSLKQSKSDQILKLFKKIDINIPDEGFIFDFDVFKKLNNNNEVIGNISMDYSLVLNNSLSNLKSQYDNDDEFSKNQLECIDAIEVLIDRYIDKLSYSDRLDKQELISYFENIKYKKVNSFKEGLQRILFFNQLLWQTGHILNGLGRLDLILDDIYNQDDISKEEAYSLIKDFLEKLHSHYFYKSSILPGDTGQIIVVGGLNENGKYFVNDLTYLFIEALKELQIPDPKIILRYSSNIPNDLLELSVRTMQTGIGSPLISNDAQVIKDLIDFGYSPNDACNYVVSACWEPAPIKKGLELNNIDQLVFIEPLNDLLDNEDLSNFNNFEDFLNSYKLYLKNYVIDMLDDINQIDWENDPLISLFIENKSNTDVSNGSAVYNNYGVTSVSLSNTVNSLYNVKTLVFDNKRFTLEELNEYRKNNFEDDEILSTLKGQIKFGMDDEYILELTNGLTKYVSDIFSTKTTRYGGKFKFGLSAPSYITDSLNINASLDGRKDFEPFNVHISLEDNKDYTEIMRFASKLDYSENRFNGNVVDFMVSPDFINKNFDKFLDFIKLSLDMGVFQMQLNVVDSKTLIDAQNNPDRYPNLIVRVWGFSTYFKDLPKNYQDVLIKRALENEGKSY